MRRFSVWSLILTGSILVALSCAPTEPLPEDVNRPQSDLDIEREGLPEPSNPAVKVQLAELPKSLRQRIEAAVANVRARDLTTTNGFWTVFHGILGLGPGVELVDPKTKERINALDYICNGGTLRGLVFKPTLLGVEVVSTMDSVGQGHQDQFLAEMAQWNMPANRKMMVQGKEYSFMDFVNFSQARASLTQNQELSWTIILLAQYKGTDISWKNPLHEKIHFEDIVRYELEANVENAACGGTHRLFGLSWAYHLHLQKGGKTEGIWKGIPEKTAKYRDLAKQYRNPDGSLSTSFFRGPGNAPDKNVRINTTGHMIEWLALALSDEELREGWVQEAVNALCMQILDLQGAAIDGGSMYHAVHGLLIYYARVFDRSICPKELLVPLPPHWKQV